MRHHQAFVVTISIKNIKGIRYVYFSYYDKGRGCTASKSCGPASSPESRLQAEAMEREHLAGRMRALEAELSRVRDRLEAMGGILPGEPGRGTLGAAGVTADGPGSPAPVPGAGKARRP